jgi:hypothetical protein
VLVWGLGVFGVLNIDPSQYLSNLEDIYSIFYVYYQYLFRCTPSSDNKASIHPTLGITPSVAKGPSTTVVLGWLGVGGF